MHFHLPFTTPDILWALMFATHLVLLVVLLGRDRASRFPIFTASIVLTALRLLISRMLQNALPQMMFVEIMLVTLCLGVVVSLLVLLELARKAFCPVRRVAWVAGSLSVMTIGAIVLWKWGPWPPWEAVRNGSTWQLLQLIAQKGSRLVDIETVLVGFLVIALGARFGAGWRTHTQRIMIGLSTASIAQIGFQATWESIIHHVRANPSMIKSMADQQHLIALGDKLTNANTMIMIAAMIWFIVTLWLDEPGHSTSAPAITAGEPAALPPVGDIPAPERSRTVE